MLDLSKPVQTRNGRAVRIFATDLRNDRPIVGAVLNGETEEVRVWTRGGLQFLCQASGGDGDLVNVPEKRVAWVNVYPQATSDLIHTSESNADDCANGNRLACVKIEYEVPTCN